MGITCSRTLLVEHKAQLQLHQRRPPGLQSRKFLSINSTLGQQRTSSSWSTINQMGTSFDHQILIEFDAIAIEVGNTLVSGKSDQQFKQIKQ
jgi:hypothetical protein